MTDGADGTTPRRTRQAPRLLPPVGGAYGGVSGFYTFGPQGAALKQAIEDTWRDRFTIREGNVEVDAPTVMPEAVFEASGHLDGFDDMLVECPDCGESHRADHVIEDGTDLEDAEALPVEEVEEPSPSTNSSVRTAAPASPARPSRTSI